MEDNDIGNLYLSSRKKAPLEFNYDSNQRPRVYSAERRHGVDASEEFNSKFVHHYQFHRLKENAGDPFNNRKYDYNPQSTTDTLTTVTASSHDSFSFGLSLSNTNQGSAQVESPRVNGYYYDDIGSSPSLDSRLDYLAAQDTASIRLRKEAVNKEKAQNSRRQLPPIPRSPSPFHARLAESHTKATLMRRNSSKVKLMNEVGSKPHFYTTIAKANSFSDSTVSSVSMFSLEKQMSKKKVCSSFHSRLAVSQTISSSLRLQKQRSEKPPKMEKVPASRKPFYTTVQSKQENSANKSARKSDKTGSLIHIKRDSYLYQSQDSSSAKQRRPSNARQGRDLYLEDRRRGGSRSRGVSIYDRLAYTGTAASLQRNRNSLQYKEEHKTLHESCKFALLREFKGSTFVPVTRSRVTKAVIGSVVNCG